MDSIETIELTVVEFFAFGIKNQRIYRNTDFESIESELNTICNTKQLVSITKYSATELETQKFNGQNDAP